MTQNTVSECGKIGENRQKLTPPPIPPLLTMADPEMLYWMTHFILEVRKRNGEPYPPNSLYPIIAGVMCHIRHTGRAIDCFKDASFCQFRVSLDAELKRLQGEGIGSHKRRAEIITESEENILWKKGLLGDTSPQTLLDTMVFCCGLYFALRSGKEHRQLRHNPCQIELVEHPRERAFLRYTEDISKNHQGGLKGRKIQPKVVMHGEFRKQQRCFVRLFKRDRSSVPLMHQNMLFIYSQHAFPLSCAGILQGHLDTLP